MLHPAMLLASVYRYTSNYNYLVNREKIERELLSLSRSGKNNSYIEKTMLKHSLNAWFDIKSKDSLIDTVNQLLSNNESFHPALSALIKIYKKNKNITSNRSSDLNIHLIKNVTEKFRYIHENKNHDEYSDYILKTVESLIDEKSEIITKLNHFLQTHAELTEQNEFTMLTAFDLSRAIDIVGCGHTVGYIDDDEANDLLNTLLDITLSIYKSWDAYLSDMIMGKLFMMFDMETKSSVIIDAQSYIDNVYGLISSINKPLYICNYWLDSNLDSLSSKLQELCKDTVEFYKKMKHKGEKIKNNIECYSNYIQNQSQLLDIDNYFNTSQYDLEIITPLDDIKDDDTPFEKRANKLGIPITDQSNPFLIFNNTIFTENGIHILEKSFFKKKKHFFSWSEAKFDTSLSKLGLITVSANGINIIKLTPNYKKLGYSQMKFDSLSRNDAEAVINDELITIKNMFNQIPNLIS